MIKEIDIIDDYLSREATKMKRGMKIVLLISILTLAGCMKENGTMQDLTNSLAKMHQFEKDYEVNQQGIQVLEQKEQQLFEELMNHSKKEHVLIREKMTEAQKSIEKRMELFAIEQQAMQNAEQLIKPFAILVKDAEGLTDEEKEILLTKVKNRYEAYRQFATNYTKLMEEQAILYSLLLDSETTDEQLVKQINHVNEQVAFVKESIENFNEKTKLMNAIKKQLIKEEE